MATRRASELRPSKIAIIRPAGIRKSSIRPLSAPGNATDHENGTLLFSGRRLWAGPVFSGLVLYALYHSISTFGPGGGAVPCPLGAGDCLSGPIERGQVEPAERAGWR